MTLDEAIAHCLEVAEQNETSAITYKNCKEIKANMYEKLTAEKAENDCRECAADHRQLAEWLTELKDLREENKVLTSECDRLIKEKGELLSKVGGGDVLRICQLEEQIKDWKEEYANLNKISYGFYEELKEAKQLLKAAVEDIVWLNEHTVDGEGQCLIETATDMETCLACPLNVNNSHVCGWKHQAEALALIGEDGDTNG